MAEQPVPTSAKGRSAGALSTFQRKALEVVRDNHGIRPREFARMMWPDSDGWQRSTRCGPNGSHRGGGMQLAGGALLGKLYKKGWVRLLHRSRFDTGHELTDAGRAALVGSSLK